MRNPILKVKFLMFLFVVILLTCGISDISNGNEPEVWHASDCEYAHLGGNRVEAVVWGDVWTIGGPVYSLEITAYINGEYLGIANVGDLPANSPKKRFVIRGVHETTRQQYSCSLEASWLTSPPTEPDDDPPDTNQSDDTPSDGDTSSTPVEESDLIIEPPMVSKNRLAPGEDFTLSATVKNDRTGSSAATTLRYYRSTDATISTSDTEVGTDTVSSLGANGRSDEIIRLTAPTDAGTYYYGACVDTVANESHSHNNCSTAVSITVEAIDPTIHISTLTSLTETTLEGSEIRLTLRDGTYEALSSVRSAVQVSGIVGVTVGMIKRVSDTEIAVPLAFDGTDFDTDGTLTLTVGADAIANYSGNALTAEVPITAIEESISVSVASPLTEETLDGSEATLTLIDSSYEQVLSTISNALTVSGIVGVTVGTVRRVSDTEISVTLAFDGTDFDTDGTLTLTVGADAIANYSGNALTAEVPVTAIEESISAAVASPLTEETLDESEATLTLIGSSYEQMLSTINDALTVSGIVGVTVGTVRRVSDTEVTIALAFDGTDFDTDAPLTFTVGADAIAGYRGSALTVEVSVSAIEEIEFDLSVPVGMSMIHVPLKVTAVDGVAKTITSIADLYDALGGAQTVNFLIAYDPQTQEWRSYFRDSDRGYANVVLTDDMGILAGMKAPTTVRLRGDALGSRGSGTITLTPGPNVVGLPLRDPSITRVSNLFALDGIRDNVPVIILTEDGEFKAIGWAGDPGDIPIVGGQGFILIPQQAATVTISGEAWANVSATVAAPPVVPRSVGVGNTTPVLALKGAVIEEHAGVNRSSFRVVVKNLSTGRTDGTVTAPDEVGYQLTVVDVETGHAARIGDTLEISAQAPNPFIGVEPLRYTITAEDVERSLIQLPELVAYEIPAETELLPNYPNPFNPETWIPYRLAEDAFVSLTIYDSNGSVVRSLDIGYQPAGVYENRSKAVYWDGRNEFGEAVASGVYFYHLSAGRSGLSVPHRSDYSQMRKMVILK